MSRQTDERVGRRFWLSWYQPGPDERPITYPPPEGIIGWWTSGETCEENPRFTLCALVDADSPKDAWAIVRGEKAWPNAGEERFCNSVESDYAPGGGRFILNDWMKARNVAALSSLPSRPGKGEA